MAICVRLLGGGLVSADFNETMTVTDVCERVAKVRGVSQSRIRLFTTEDCVLLEPTLSLLSAGTNDFTVAVLPVHAPELSTARLAEVCTMAQKDHIASTKDTNTIDFGTIGDPPHVLVHVKSMSPILGAPGGGFIGGFSRMSRVCELREYLYNVLDVSNESLSMSYGGRDLVDDRTLEENGIVSPGPAARRTGARVAIIFSISLGECPGFASKAIIQSAIRRGVQEWETFVNKYIAAVDGFTSDETRIEVNTTDEETQICIEKPSWWDKWPAAGEAHCFFVSEEVRSSIQQLVDLTWDGDTKFERYHVEAVLRNENRTLWERYCHKRTLVKASQITKGEAMSLELDYELASNYLGELDASINEFLLFQGIEPSQADCLCNTCEIPELGFFFADTSVGGDRRANSEYIGEMHGTFVTMLLCRVICGNQLHATESEVKQYADDLRRQCTTIESGYHSVVGHANEALDKTVHKDYVIFNLDQVYPEFLVFYRRVPRA